MFLLIPACGLFFFFDQKLLNDWRSTLFDAWVKKDIDFSSFCEAVSANPILPKNTLQSMLATLPSVGDLMIELRISVSTRESIAAVVTAINACRSDAIALKVAGYAIVGGSLLIAAALEMWQPLLGIVAIAPLILLPKRLRLWRLKSVRERMLAAQRQLDFDHKKWAELVACLAWKPISTSEKEAFLNSWSVCQRNTPVSS